MKTPVGPGNSLEIAAAIVQHLAGKKFHMVTFYHSGPNPQIDEPNVLLSLTAGSYFSNKDGVVEIPLTPRRKISWDFINEVVFVTFRDDGSIVLERQKKEKILYRVIVTI